MAIGVFMPGAVSGGFDPPGSVQFTTAGTHSFTVPKYASTLRIRLWGGGAGGAGVWDSPPWSVVSGSNGGTSRITSLSLVANGGNASTRAGGTASGGTTNTSGDTGEAGTSTYGGKGGNSPSGGSGGSRNSAGWSDGRNGSAPGGGGGGGFRGDNSPSAPSQGGGGGGGGGYCDITYALGAISPGAVLSIEVGAAGAGATNSGNFYKGGNGAVGRVRVDWE